MQNSKLISILKFFNKKDLKRFEDFLKSPFFNKNDELVKTYIYIKKFAPLFNKPKLSKEKTFAFVFPDKAYNEKKIGYLMSDLLKMVEDFIAIKRIEDQPILKYQQILQYYNEWKLEKPFHSSMRDARKQLKSYPYKDGNFFYYNYLLEEEENEFIFKVKQNQNEVDQSLQRVDKSIDQYFILQKLRCGCELYNRRNIVAGDYQIPLLKEIIDYVESDLYLKNSNPAIMIYFQTIKSLINSEETNHFFILKELLQEHNKSFAPKEARNMFLFAINYCVKKINSGQAEFKKELFEIYKNTIEGGLITLNGQLNFTTFKNINSIACLVKEYEWAENFIQQYGPALNEENRNNAIMYNMALLHFYKNDFQTAHEYLYKVEPTADLIYNLDSRLLLLRVYYELNEFQALNALFSSFRIYIKRNKMISDGHRDVYLNLINAMKELLKYQDEPKQLQILKENVKEERIAVLTWLIAKIEERLALFSKKTN